MNNLGQGNVSGRQQHLFSRVASSNAVKYSTFDTSHSHLTAIDSGYLYPIYCEEVLPGEYRKLKSRHLVRMSSPAVVAFMQNLYFCMEYFYVRNRHIYDKFPNLFGEQRNPNDSVDFPIPMLNSGDGVPTGSIFDIMGVPPNIPGLEFSALPFRAYNFIYNEWYRDQNLQDWCNVGGTGDSHNPDDEFGETDQLENYTLKKRNRKHDYFMSGLPWQQKGDPVVLNFSGELPVYGNGQTIGFEYSNGFTGGSGSASDGGISAYQGLYGENIDTQVTWGTKGSYAPVGLTSDSSKSGIVADTAGITGVSIPDFIVAMQLQAIKVQDALGGTRYKEKVWNEFKVRISDAVLDRPEYLGGFSTAFYTTPITQTSSTDETSPQGNLTAVSHAFVDNPMDFVKGFEEHGWIIGMASIRTDNQYQQGLHRKFSRKNRFDFFTPLLENISEQAVLKKELVAQGTNAINDEGNLVDDETLLFQEAWSEYKYGQNKITGKMRSNLTNPSDSLDRWHLGLVIDPANGGLDLNSEFIEENIPLDRVLSVPGTEENPQPQFIVNSWFNELCTKPMAIYSIPAYLGGRF